MKRALQQMVAAAGAIGRHRLAFQCDAIPYSFQDLPLNKIANWLRVEASTRIHPSIPWGIPTHLQIEPTNTCNLRCELCPVSGQMTRPSGFMDVTLYRRLLDEIGDYVFLILFWDWGEPFMHPSAFDMISDARRKGIRVVSSTNGHLLADPYMADAAIHSGLDTLIFAVDGISQNTYERYRHRGDLQKVLTGIRTVVERKKYLKSKTPLINFRFICMRHNEHEIDQLPSFVQALGIDVLTLKTLNPGSDNTYGDKTNGAERNENPLVPLDPRYQRFVYDSSGKPVRRNHNPCRNPWNAPAIHWNGTVCPCTYDYDERYILGNLNHDSFLDIWKGAAYRAFRKHLRSNDRLHYFCRECSYACKGGSCIDETVHEAVFFRRRQEA